MSRNGSGIYNLPTVYKAETGDVIVADQHNTPLEDIRDDLNAARPIVAGGTGATTASAARTALSVPSISDVQTGYVPRVATKAALSALDTASFKAAVLTEATREKLWMWKTGDFSTEEAGDTDHVNYIAADGVSTSLGCWVAATGDGVTVRTIAAGGTGADNAADARTNLGLGSAATSDTTDFATAAQGALADSALQDASAFATAAQGAKADSAVQSTATDASTFSFVNSTGPLSDSGTTVPADNVVKAYADGILPAITDQGGKYIRAKSDESGQEYTSYLTGATGLGIDNDVANLDAVNVYSPTDALSLAASRITSAFTTDQTGKERYTLFIGNYDSGTGDGTVLGSTYGLGISAIKDSWASTTREGQMHGLSIVTRGGFHGTNPNPGGDYNPGDTAGIVINSLGSSSQSYVATLEGVSAYAKDGTYAFSDTDPVHQIRFQIGPIREVDNAGIGMLVVAEAGALGAAFQAQNLTTLDLGAGTWSKFLSYVTDFGSGAYEAFSVNQIGNIVMNNGPDASTPNSKKTVRVGGTGSLEVINSAGSTAILLLSDVGALAPAYSVDLPSYAAASPPTAASGRIWFDGTNGKIKICEDGSTWKTVTTS